MSMILKSYTLFTINILKSANIFEMNIASTVLYHSGNTFVFIPVINDCFVCHRNMHVPVVNNNGSYHLNA